jgi:GNAT superfamily N-acetyltransferase
MIVRKARMEDRKDALEAEGLATPNLHYLDRVYDEWLADHTGEMMVAEDDGKVVAVGKFSVVPDGSAWLEALRVRPDVQGRGIGKAFYRRFFELAEGKGIDTMRMYTGVTNAVSKGLAELFGFTLAGTFRGYTLQVPHTPETGWDNGFAAITDGDEAVDLLAPHAADWAHFHIMNRTFFKASAPLWKDWAARGWVYHHPESQSKLILGARFIPEQALHMAMFSGDADRIFAFAAGKAREKGNDRLQCMVPAVRSDLRELLEKRGFVPDSSDCIVMEYRKDA